MSQRFFGACLALLALVLCEHGSAASGPNSGSDASHAPRPAVTYRGGLVTPPLLKPRFMLIDTAGAPFDFWEKTRGSVTLLFFGYTHCPDQCPLHMANIAVGLNKMPKDLSDQVKVVFVTTDPSRDNPKAVRAWLDRFDERFIGLTGSEAAIEEAQRAAGLSAARKTALAAGDYAVAHASFVVAYTKDNLGHLIYPSGMTQQDWTHDLPRLVNETWSGR